MRKLLLCICLCASLLANGQLEKGSKLIGIQTGILSNDELYYTRLQLILGSSENGYGFNIVPTFGYALERNWLVGLQAVMGIQRSKDMIGTIFQRNDFYTDLGIAPFTRYYVDLSKNQRFKFFGAAAFEIVHNTLKRSSGYPSESTFYSSRTKAMGSLGAGLAYFGKKISFDVSAGNLAIRMGFYKTLGSRKK